MSRLWEEIADEIRAYAEEKARKNDLRDQYLDVIGNNRWRNEVFNNLVDLGVFAFEEWYKDFSRGTRDDDEVIVNVAEAVVDGHFSKIVLDDRAIRRELDSDVVRDMQKCENLFLDLLEDFESTKRPRGRRDRDDDWRRHRNSGRDRDDRVYGGTRHGRDDGWRSRSRYSSWGRDERRDEGTSMGVDAMLDAVRSHNRDRDDHRDREDTREDYRESGRKTISSDREERPVRHERPARAEQPPAVDGPDFTKARPFDDFWLDGEHYQAAHLSDWKITFNPDDPLASLPSLYDVRHSVRFLVKSQDGTVREEFMSVSEDNRYLAHELMSHKPEVTRPRATVSLKNRNQVEETQVELDEIIEKKEEVTLESFLDKFEPVNADESTVLSIDNISTATFTVRAEMSKTGKPVNRSHFLVREPLVAKSWKQLDLIHQVAACNNLSQAAAMMRELKDQFEEPIWVALNSRFTNLVLRASRFQFQYNRVKTMNFANHWENLLKVMGDERGQEFVAEFARRTAYIVTQACLCLDREEVPEQVSSILEYTDDLPVILFVDFLTVFGVSTTSDDLGIGEQLANNATGVALTNTANPYICKKLRELIADSEKVVPASWRPRYLLVTADNKNIEIIPFSGRQDNYILAEV